MINKNVFKLNIESSDRQCLQQKLEDLPGDKIIIIQKEIHSIIDLVDILEGDCLFDDEFYEVFKSLNDMELALLLKRLPSYTEDLSFHLTEDENK